MRVNEVSALIDEIQGADFLKTTLFGENCSATMALDKLIMAGHSMGGATALSVGDRDPRIKAVICHDPWADAIMPKIASFGSILQKPLQMTNTSQFSV